MANGGKNRNINNGEDKMDNLHFTNNELGSDFVKSCANQIVGYKDHIKTHPNNF